MGLVLTVEAWIVSLFGWAWLTLQDMWLPSLLCAHMYYGFLVLTTLHLVFSAVFLDWRAPRIAYFQCVLGMFVFYTSSIADAFDLSSSPLDPSRNSELNISSSLCCANCNVAETNRVFFFSTTSHAFLVQAGIAIGYLLVHLLIAAAQMLDSVQRSVWPWGAWGNALGMLLACRFIVTFDESVMFLVPSSLRYVLLFSQPIVGAHVCAWIALLGFVVLFFAEGFPNLDVLGIRIVRCIGLGFVVVFSVGYGVVFVMRDMLTLPLVASLVLLVLGGVLAVVEAFLGLERYIPPSLAGAPVGGRVAGHSTIGSHRMQGGKKAA